MGELSLVFPELDQGRAFERIIASYANPERHRHPVRTETRRHFGYTHRVVSIDVSEVLFARPQHLDGSAVQGFRNGHGLLQLAMHSTSAKSATLKAVVDEDVIGRQACELCGFKRGIVRSLCANPNLCPVRSYPCRAVWRLHLRMRLVRQVVLSFDDLRRTTECHLDITFVDRGRASLVQRSTVLIKQVTRTAVRIGS